APAQEERAVERTVREAEPVRLHHVGRVAVRLLEGVRDTLQPCGEQAAALQLRGEALPFERVRQRRESVGDGGDCGRLRLEGVRIGERVELERVAGARGATGCDADGDDLLRLVRLDEQR